MTQVFFLIDQLALGLYILMAAVIMRYGYRLLLAAGDYRATYFELERSLARHRQMNATTGIIVAAEIVLLVLGVQQTVVPFLEQEATLQQVAQARRANMTDGEFVTATPPPRAQGAFDIEPVPPLVGDDEQIILLTPTLTPTPVGTIVPNPPASEGCDDPRAQLQVPANGMRVFQPIAVRGTAYTSNFASAKIEIKGPDTNNSYQVVADILQPVQNLSDFYQFNPAVYGEGVYQFRLMIYDVSSTLVAACMVNIYISDPATPTPAPGN